ncbi:MAG: phage N-6-adenine-methyltransferase [Sporolactobacillus sp.]
MVADALFKSEKMDWETPQWLFDQLNEEFDFGLDAAANALNRKCDSWISEEIDALQADWYGDGNVWLNPPYGRHIGQWIEKAYQESRKGMTVVVLVPARTDTAWWHDWAMQADEIRFIRGRLKFVGAASSAPFPSAILVFKQVAPKFVSYEGSKSDE